MSARWAWRKLSQFKWSVHWFIPDICHQQPFSIQVISFSIWVQLVQSFTLAPNYTRGNCHLFDRSQTQKQINKWQINEDWRAKYLVFVRNSSAAGFFLVFSPSQGKMHVKPLFREMALFVNKKLVNKNLFRKMVLIVHIFFVNKYLFRELYLQTKILFSQWFFL